MTPPEADRPQDEELSQEARAFLDRPLFAGALWLGVGLLVVILGGAVASLFIKPGPEADMSVAATIVRMFLRR